MTGPIPDTLKDLPDLELINLSENRLDGSIPGYLPEIPRLKTPLLHDNRFTGCTPAALEGLVSIGQGALTQFCSAVVTPPSTSTTPPTPVTTDHSGDRSALLSLFEAAGGAPDPNPNRDEMIEVYYR